MKIRPVGTELFHEDGRTGRYDEANSRFSQFAKAHKFGPDSERDQTSRDTILNNMYMNQQDAQNSCD